MRTLSPKYLNSPVRETHAGHCGETRGSKRKHEFLATCTFVDHAHASAHTHSTHTHTHTQTCRHTHTQTCRHTDMQTHTHRDTHSHSHRHVDTHTHTLTHTLAHTHSLTHSRSLTHLHKLLSCLFLNSEPMPVEAVSAPTFPFPQTHSLLPLYHSTTTPSAETSTQENAMDPSLNIPSLFPDNDIQQPHTHRYTCNTCCNVRSAPNAASSATRARTTSRK